MIQIIRKDYTAEDYRRLGEKCITDYYKRYYPFDQGKTLGLEENIYFPLDEEKDYWIRGFIDRVTLGRIIPSLKSMITKPPADFLLRKMSIQIDNLPFYQMGVEGKWKDIQEIRLIWHYLAFDTEIRSSRTPEKLHQLRRGDFGTHSGD